jgi:hypothetical protein
MKTNWKDVVVLFDICVCSTCNREAYIYIYIFCIIIGTDQVRPEGSEVPNPNSYVGGMFWRHLGIVGMVLTDSLMPIVTE